MFEAWLERATGMVWNYPVVGLCLFAGLFFTLRLGFVQLRGFFHAIALICGRYDTPNEKGHITHFQALSAALSGTIGLGNIAGVAIAIAMGGPGAIFWMWVIAFLGMATKFAECTLGTLFREEDRYGRVHGGPMYYITNGLGAKWKPLANAFAICAAIGAFGFADMFQSNQVAVALHKHAHIPYGTTGLILAVLVGLTIIGGIRRIGSVASKIVPFMCGIYIFSAVGICLAKIDLLPVALRTIVSDAFTGWAVAGGAVGTVLITAVRRAVFSNEAGLGSASIAHAAVKTDHPVREGIVASLGPFIDTVLVCTSTALVIVLSGFFGSGMYQGIQNASINPSERHSFQLLNGWQMTLQVPPESPDMRRHRDKEYGLALKAHDGTGVLVTPRMDTIEHRSLILGSENAKGHKKVAHGVRFSSWREGPGKRFVDILDNRGRLIASLPVNAEGETLYVLHGGEQVPYISIDGQAGDSSWHHHIITFHDPFREQILRREDRLSQVRLQFRGEESSGLWYLDRIQTVRELAGVELTIAAFDRFLDGFGAIMVTLAICFFAYSTIITWSYYGETAVVYVLGPNAITPFRWLFAGAAYLGAVVKLGPVLNFSDLMAGLMVIPNFIAIMLLSGVVRRESSQYFARLKSGEFQQRARTIRVSHPKT